MCTWVDCISVVANIVTIVGGVLIVAWMYDRYFKGHSIRAEPQRTFVARFSHSEPGLKDRVGVGFYSLMVTNLSHIAPLAIRHIQLRYRLGNQVRTVNPRALNTWNLQTGERCVRIQGPADQESIVLLNWHEVHDQLNAHTPLDPGAFFDCSAYFLLEERDVADQVLLRDVQVVVTDSRGRTSTWPMPLNDAAYDQFLRRDMKLYDRPSAPPKWEGETDDVYAQRDNEIMDEVWVLYARCPHCKRNSNLGGDPSNGAGQAPEGKGEGGCTLCKKPFSYRGSDVAAVKGWRNIPN